MADKPIDIIETEQTDELIQTGKEKKLAQRVQELFRASFDAKDQLNLNEKWAMFDDYKHGRQNPKQSEDHPGSETNIIHTIIEGQIADLVDKPVSVGAEGEEPSDDLYADQVQHQMEYIIRKNRHKEKLNVSEHDRLELGSTIIKTFFDPDALNKRGLPTYEIVSPANFFPDPKWSATHLLQECEFIIHAVSRPLSYIRKKFPKRGKYVQRETSVPYDPDIFEDQDSDEVSTATSQKALLIECYMHDEDGKLYCVHVANHILLEDSREVLKDKKLQRRDLFPFVAIPCYVQRGIGWGQGDVELLVPTQDLINDLDDQIRTNARLMANPQIVFGAGAGRGFDVRKWTTRAGLRIPMRDHNAYSVVRGQNIASDVPNRRDKAFQEADIISGRTEVTRGETPGQITAAAAIVALQQAGQKGVLHKAEMLKQGWNQVLELLYDDMVENWDEEMWIRISGETPDFKFYNPASLKNVPIMIPNANAGPGEDSLIELMDREEKIDEETGELIVSETVMTREADFDLSLSMGNGLPSDKSFIYQTLIELSNITIEGRPAILWSELREYLRDQVGLPLGDDVQAEQQMAPPMPTGSAPRPRGSTPQQTVARQLGGM